jgi:alpha-glucosidase
VAALPAGAWPNWVLGNHDRPRIAAKVGEPQARVAAMLLLTLRGTPTLYYGDELGIGRVDIPPAQVQDPRELREPGLGLGRDPVRTPMPWDDTPNAGFSSAAPWLPLNADWRERNVARQAGAPGSMLTLHRSLLALRRARPALSIGELTLIDGAFADADVLAYERRHGDERLLVALNLGHAPRELTLPAWAHGARVLLSTIADAPAASAATADRLVLRADEGVVLAGASVR